MAAAANPRTVFGFIKPGPVPSACCGHSCQDGIFPGSWMQGSEVSTLWGGQGPGSLNRVAGLYCQVRHLLEVVPAAECYPLALFGVAAFSGRGLPDGSDGPGLGQWNPRLPALPYPYRTGRTSGGVVITSPGGSNIRCFQISSYVR
jgi:hypothetical protein